MGNGDVMGEVEDMAEVGATEMDDEMEEVAPIEEVGETREGEERNTFEFIEEIGEMKEGEERNKFAHMEEGGGTRADGSMDEGEGMEECEKVEEDSEGIAADCDRRLAFSKPLLLNKFHESTTEIRVNKTLSITRTHEESDIPPNDRHGRHPPCR